MLYLMMPYDLIPEAVYGFVGVLDDIVIVLFLIVPLTRAIYSAYTRRFSAGPHLMPQAENAGAAESADLANAAALPEEVAVVPPVNGN